MNQNRQTVISTKTDSAPQPDPASGEIYVALVHFPVVNRKGNEVGSALTTIDLHDIARACRTFGARGFYVITPYEDQAELADQVVRHWTQGVGGTLNPSRKAALELIQVVPTFEQAVEAIGKHSQKPVVTMATSARGLDSPVPLNRLNEMLKNNAAHVLVLGTAWGLTQELIDACDVRIEPITGPGSYNHLSVRSAASIYLDRITNG